MRVLYGDQTQKCVETMQFSGKRLGDYPEYVRALLLVKMAAARANLLVNALPQEIANSIQNACQNAIDLFDAKQYPVDVCHGGGGIGINMNVNEVIATLASERSGIFINPIAHVNLSQSTADVCHTALRLTIHKLLGELLAGLSACEETFRRKQNEFSGISTIARTCMMDAMVMDLGDRFSGYVEVIARRSKALGRQQKSMLAVNLGGTVIGSGEGTALGYREVVIGVLKELCGKGIVHVRNFYDAAQNMDELVALSQELSNLAQVFIKISQDLRFLASGPEAGIGELKLPKTQAGSSFFPGKVNPVLPEMMIQCGFLVIGLTRSVELAHLHGDTDLNVFEEFAGILVIDQMKALTSAIGHFVENALAGITVDNERCFVHVTSLVPTVTRFTNEFGYEAVSAVVERATQSSVSVKAALASAFPTNDHNLDVRVEE